MWSIAWLAIIYDSPDQHPRISVQEKKYIVNSIGLVDKPKKVSQSYVIYGCNIHEKFEMLQCRSLSAMYFSFHNALLTAYGSNCFRNEIIFKLRLKQETLQFLILFAAISYERQKVIKSSMSVSSKLFLIFVTYFISLALFKLIWCSVYFLSILERLIFSSFW